LEGARERMRTGGAFGEVVSMGQKAVADARTGQKMSLLKVTESGTPPDNDGFYVFRVACVGSKGWQFHAVAYLKDFGRGYWSEPVAGVYQGYRVVIEDRQNRLWNSSCVSETGPGPQFWPPPPGFTRAQWRIEGEAYDIDEKEREERGFPLGGDEGLFLDLTRYSAGDLAGTMGAEKGKKRKQEEREEMVK
jgi:hypothetical protein